MATVKSVTQTYLKILRNGKIDPDFFEFVRRLEQAGENIGSSSSRPGVVRFGQVPYLNYPKTMIADISKQNDLVYLKEYFFGLLGPTGPMPLSFTNYVFQRSHNEYDRTLESFLNIINHRFLGLYCRSWKQNEQAASADLHEKDLISTVIQSLAGGGGVAVEKRIPWYVECSNADILGFGPKSATGLEVILRRYFHRSITVYEKELTKIEIPPEYYCAMGKRGLSELGRSIQLGRSCLSKSAKFVIVVEAGDYASAVTIMPGTSGFLDLLALICRYLDRPLQYDLEIRLNRETLPDPRICGKLGLGAGIWLAGRRHGRDTLRIGASRLMEKQHRQSYIDALNELLEQKKMIKASTKNVISH